MMLDNDDELQGRFAYVRKHLRLTPYEDHVILRNILSSGKGAQKKPDDAETLRTYEKAFLFDAIHASVGTLPERAVLRPRVRESAVNPRNVFRHLTPFAVR